MASRWFSTVIDARDHGRLARWWAEVLDYQVVFEDTGRTFIADRASAARRDPEESELDPRSAPGLMFVSVPDRKSGKNRLHLDIDPDDQDAEVERLVDMGARHVDTGQRRVPWVVLADPEGNEFCVTVPRGPSV